MPAASIVYDDGSGPALYVGGSFTLAGCAVARGIARWDGVEWSALGEPLLTGSEPRLFPEINALAVYDDGRGPALYVGGSFATAGGEAAGGIARWDGESWSVLAGPGAAGVGGVLNPVVRAMAVFDDGRGPALYVGGAFKTAGGVETGPIARWDGAVWSSLEPSGPVESDGWVHALGTFDDGAGAALFVGGSFRTMGGQEMNRIARWNGAAWSALTSGSGVGLDSHVHAFEVFDDGAGAALYVGGAFKWAGDLLANRVARWDRSGWSALADGGGTGVSSQVYALSVFDAGEGEALFAAGQFREAGGVAAFNLASWNGTRWSVPDRPPSGGSNGIFTLSTFDDGRGEALYVGGNLTAGPELAAGVARWDGAAWSALRDPARGGLGGGVVNALAIYDDGSGPALIAGGEFLSAGGELGTEYIARWDGAGWAPLLGPGGGGLDGPVEALAVFDDGRGPAVYAGGSFLTADGKTVNRIARWDGAEWTALGDAGSPGVSAQVHALAVFDDGSPALYAGGRFTTAGDQDVYRIARWDGAHWSPLTPVTAALSRYVYALTVFDDGSGAALYAGGDFTSVGSQTMNRIARWDGREWSALAGSGGVGVNSPVRALAAFDDGRGTALYVGGDFSSAGGRTVYRIARWDGADWSRLGGSSYADLDNSVHALAAFDDGRGPALFVGGVFQRAAGEDVNRIARWDGHTWSSLDFGVTMATEIASGAIVRAMAPYDFGQGPDLYVAGEFRRAGGVVSNRIARWRSCVDHCRADLDGDGELTFFDFLAFQNLFAAGDLRADFTGDGVLDFFDFLAFQDEFAAGCP